MKIIWRACSVLKTWRNSMAKAGRLPDFRKMYPEASEEIISVLKETERKMQYQEYDLKAEQAVLDRKTGRVSILNITVRQSRQSGVARATCPD